MKKKLFVVSDIHGHFTEFKKALDESGFQSNNPEHLIVFLGDLFDRGSENYRTMRYFERIENCVLIKGNHEDLLLKILDEGRLRDHNFINGSMSTITEFFGKYAIDGINNSIDFSGKTRTVDRITDFIMSMRDFYETKHLLFVHGWLPNHNGVVIKDWKKATESDWETARFTKWTDVYTGAAPIIGKTIVCGHMPTIFARKFDINRKDSDTTPFFGNGIIAIDGGTYDTGKVNIVVLEDELL